MEEMVLFESELKVMDIIWEIKGGNAKEISLIANEQYGWNKNTTYTILKKLVVKEAIRREEPNFYCVPLVTKEQIRLKETKKLIQRLFNGSSKLLISSYIESENLSKEELKNLRDLIDKQL